MAGSSARNNRKRHRLHRQQGERCYYCPETIGVLIEQRGNPVLEHYIPQSAGGTLVVLACQSCDKMKGMIRGPDFEAIIREVVGDGAFDMKARQKINGICKGRNVELQNKHTPRITGADQTRQRTAMRARAFGITITEFPTLQRYATVGNSGRDQLIAECEAKRPPFAGQHYENFTAKNPGPPCVQQKTGV